MRLSGKEKEAEFGNRWKELIEKYLRALPGQLQSMRDCLASDQLETVKFLAHQVKGTSGTYGLDDIAGCAKKVELSAELGDTRSTKDGIDALSILIDARLDSL
jgi:HPt (histidine-containing phosphotransfer) domain-containing protein